MDMKKRFLPPLLLCLVCLLAACGTGDESEADFYIDLAVENFSLEENGMVYSTIQVTRQIDFHDWRPEEAVLTAITADIAAVTADYIARLEAKEAPQFAADPTISFQHDLRFSSYYLGPELISLRFSCWGEASSAAQPEGERYGLVYDAVSGKRLALADVLGADYQETAVAGILRLINQAGESENYYPDLERLLLQYLDPVSGWYADAEKVYIIYQPYTVAPGALDILKFPLAY